MKATLWLLAAALAVVGCEDKAGAPAPAQDKKSPPTKTETKPSEQAGDKAQEGDTKPAKGETSPEDAKLLTERTQKLMEALKSKNVDAIAEFMPEKEREDAKKAFAADGKAYKSFFGEGEWRNKAITTWDNKIHMVRVDGDKARVKVGEIDGKEAAVVEWEKADEQWWFKDMQSPAIEDFAKWGNELK